MMGARPLGGGRDHPRGCGEKNAPNIEKEASEGSSPRVRGEVDGSVLDGSGEGIIPAGAGRSSAPPPKRRALQDHPRGCGEKVPVR